MIHNQHICIAELGNMEEAHILRALLQNENMKPLCPKCKSPKLKTDYIAFFKDFFRTNCDREYKYCDSYDYCW